MRLSRRSRAALSSKPIAPNETKFVELVWFLTVEGQFCSGSIDMNNIIYIVGLIVVVLAVLAFFGLR